MAENLYAVAELEIGPRIAELEKEMMESFLEAIDKFQTITGLKLHELIYYPKNNTFETTYK